MTLAPFRSCYTVCKYSACLQQLALPPASAHAPLLLSGTLIHSQRPPKVRALVYSLAQLLLLQALEPPHLLPMMFPVRTVHLVAATREGPTPTPCCCPTRLATPEHADEDPWAIWQKHELVSAPGQTDKLPDQAPADGRKAPKYVLLLLLLLALLSATPHPGPRLLFLSAGMTSYMARM